jgi:hypothetical protein
MEWFEDLGFLQKPGLETGAQRDTAEFVRATNSKAAGR